MQIEEGWEALRERYGRKAKNIAAGMIYRHLTENPGKRFSAIDLTKVIKRTYPAIKEAANELEDLGLIKSEDYHPTLFWYEP